MDRNAMIVFGLPLWMIALLVCCMRVNIIIDFVIIDYGGNMVLKNYRSHRSLKISDDLFIRSAMTIMTCRSNDTNATKVSQHT